MNNIKFLAFKFFRKCANFAARIGLTKNAIPGSRAIFNFLFGFFWPYGDTIEIQGSKMFFDYRNEPLKMRFTFEEYAKNKIHEKTTTELFRKTLKPGNTFLDLGANIGYFTLLAANLVGSTGKVYSFEPEKNNFKHLLKNIEINNYTWVNPSQKAVSENSGTTKLFICSYDSGHNTINQNEGIKAYSRGRKVGEESIEIETIKLDDMFSGKEESIDVVKMDVEGAEFLALKGMENILSKNQKIKLFVEFFPLLIEKMGNSPREFIDRIISHGFNIYMIPDDYSAGTGNLKKVKGFEEIMESCKEEDAHVNLFLTHENI